MRVLIVEDEAALADIVAEGLRDEGIAADVAYDTDSGTMLATTHKYDVIVLDRDTPALGYEDTRRRLAASRARLLVVAAPGDLETSPGADAYLTKPFTYPELIERVRALGTGGGHRVGL
ncbi:DNA-binding response OmpR family regulator [Thermocatellispora tengchongensis]|uniref:DNA-binding response OmpR family regulator n=1 Tax=Thermocatellispora tengchongensis TaxID=1073253 RepID=A0A840P3H6_9ACTN|nr:response regulator [Thermocatellispora tengchongensis]MBB5133922.1 DNA-binding response OmpR family regulator [Thermocatellispora tengchongensis]